MEDTLKRFHGENYSRGPWNSKVAKCCDLCKTKNVDGKHRHWAKNLCRSCYRRLSASHRLYNDKWNQENSRSTEFRKKSGKKQYKESPEVKEMEFSREDIKSLLERYNFSCAYCHTQLQDYDHKAGNAFQVEYRLEGASGSVLVPICRTCNCSKKNIPDGEKLRRWAEERGIDFPIIYIDPLR